MSAIVACWLNCDFEGCTESVITTTFESQNTTVTELARLTRRRHHDRDGWYSKGLSDYCPKHTPDYASLERT